MEIVADTSVIIAVIANEAHKRKILELTRHADLIAPNSLEAEVGNALSAMFKRNRISLGEAIAALKYFRKIPIRFFDLNLEYSVQIASESKIYAYDAYFISCAAENNAPLFSLDRILLENAKRYGIKVLEV